MSPKFLIGPTHYILLALIATGFVKRDHLVQTKSFWYQIVAQIIENRMEFESN